MDIRPHLESLRQRFDRLLADLSTPEVAANPSRLQQLQREHARLAPVIAEYETFLRLGKEREELTALANGSDADFRQMAIDDLQRVQASFTQLEDKLRLALLPRDPNDDRNIIVEIRAGAGGDEASLFAADLMRMYSRYCETHGFRIEPVESSMSERGGIKEVIVGITGREVWKHFKYERGVHRVQRVPATEANGRIHTSTATVAVLPEAEEVDVKIDPSDLRIDTFRASGAGGQHINKTDSAVRITHIPTGLAVACQEERSQIKNRAKAMTLLRSRLLEQAQEKRNAELTQDRRSQVGTGDRSEKIRTYNYPQDRITDHRINFSVHNLPAVMEGKLEPLINELQRVEQAQQLADLSAKSDGVR
jgi:peptide chain release factor 1